MYINPFFLCVSDDKPMRPRFQGAATAPCMSIVWSTRFYFTKPCYEQIKIAQRAAFVQEYEQLDKTCYLSPILQP
jgi:hypothetical protein